VRSSVSTMNLGPNWVKWKIIRLPFDIVNDDNTLCLKRFGGGPLDISNIVTQIHHSLAIATQRQRVI